jgi:hypothetical protein
MYITTGEKSYLLTDYRPSRKYFVVKFTDGNGEQWFQLGYRWGLWTFYMQSLRKTDYGTYKSPLQFNSAEKAAEHIRAEHKWLDRQEKSGQVVAEVVQ